MAAETTPKVQLETMEEAEKKGEEPEETRHSRCQASCLCQIRARIIHEASTNQSGQRGNAVYADKNWQGVFGMVE